VTRETGLLDSGRSRPRMNKTIRGGTRVMASSKADGESLGPGQRPEHPAFLGFQQEDRKERDDDDQKREEKRRSYLLGRIQKDSLSFAGRDAALLRFIASARVLRFGQMPVAIFHHH